MDEQLYALRCFFDIYENNDENARIIARTRHGGIDAVRDELEVLPCEASSLNGRRFAQGKCKDLLVQIYGQRRTILRFTSEVA